MGLAAAIVTERRDLLARTERLVAEFPGLPAGAVIGRVTRGQADLLRAGIRRGLAAATEAQVRDDLRGAAAPGFPGPWHRPAGESHGRR